MCLGLFFFLGISSSQQNEFLSVNPMRRRRGKKIKPDVALSTKKWKREKR